jgi:ferredoxin
MAYTRGLPLLVERGLLEEAMFESKYDWRVKHIEPDTSYVDLPDRCRGCGLCVAACPEKAIRLERVSRS